MAERTADLPADCEGRECHARMHTWFHVAVQGRVYKLCRACLGKVLGALKCD